MNKESIAAQVQRLRQENASIRDIAKRLGVSKYTVEKTLKELEAARLQTIYLAMTEDSVLPKTDTAMTVSQTAGKVDQVSSDINNKARYSGGNLLLSRVDALLNGASTEEKESGIAEKQLYSTYFFDVMMFLSEYRKLMVLLQRDVGQGRNVWLHVVNGKYLKELARLQQEASRLCQRDTREYSRTQLADVLIACEAYLKKVLLTPEARGSMIGLSWVRLPKDERILALCKITFRAEDPFVYTHGCQAAA
ncbi:MarR family transcriptional regulator [Pontibacter anaerobius]|uniref:Helix-turn-helix domain-containing protein n=1 Tax=Pontibacter anaerobius TaxID=2993940 RepID=A0ABT3RKA7_9BACT|nr:helix-turn-helix domain-containing protein [Pontibacter anaerobius]MCX2741991.1 helix-turn-helix domain-containing protein [Pontibacter anaerobius]